ncbi:putative PUA-like superfamily, SRA-YDG superfamily protein [Helianthus anomalus]
MGLGQTGHLETYKSKRVGLVHRQHFLFWMEICVVRLHGLPQAEIHYLSLSQSSIGDPIATSIIVSGGYEDQNSLLLSTTAGRLVVAVTVFLDV